MIIKNIFRNYGMMALSALMLGSAFCFTACKEDDDKNGGETFFRIDGAENGVLKMGVNGVTETWAFGSGYHYVVRAKGSWELVPVDDEMPDWMRIFPMAGKDEGILRFYASLNPMATVRTAEFRVFLNGVEQPERLVLAQDPSGPTMTLTADVLQLKQGGGTFDVFVTANYEWTFENNADWLTVSRDDNKLTIASKGANTTGTDLTTTVILRGTGDNSAITTPISVTQLNALFFDDFSWCYTPINKDWANGPDLDAVVCWGDQNLRIDKWEDPVKSDNPGWTAVRGTGGATYGPYTYSRYQYILFSTSSKCGGNICSPALTDIEGAINATVSWSMAGFVTAKGAQEAGNEFWVAILGPGRITDAIAGGASKGSVATGTITIPYEKSGNTPPATAGTHDTDLTECVQFFIDKGNGYFDPADATGLSVWKQPETQFAIKVEGMTAETRIVFIACDAQNLTMETGEGWDVRAGNSNYKSNRKLFDNYKVVAN